MERSGITRRYDAYDVELVEPGCVDRRRCSVKIIYFICNLLSFADGPELSFQSHLYVGVLSGVRIRRPSKEEQRARSSSEDRLGSNSVRIVLRQIAPSNLQASKNRPQKDAISANLHTF